MPSCLLFLFFYLPPFCLCYWFSAASQRLSAWQKENKRCFRWRAACCFDYLLSIRGLWAWSCRGDCLLVKASAPRQDIKAVPKRCTCHLQAPYAAKYECKGGVVGERGWKKKYPQMPWGQVFVHPSPLLWSHLSSKAGASSSLLRGIRAKAWCSRN